jgi:hypothetical protein
METDTPTPSYETHPWSDNSALNPCHTLKMFFGRLKHLTFGHMEKYVGIKLLAKTPKLFIGSVHWNETEKAVELDPVTGADDALDAFDLYKHVEASLKDLEGSGFMETAPLIFNVEGYGFVTLNYNRKHLCVCVQGDPFVD